MPNRGIEHLFFVVVRRAWLKQNLYWVRDACCQNSCTFYLAKFDILAYDTKGNEVFDVHM